MKSIQHKRQSPFQMKFSIALIMKRKMLMKFRKLQIKLKKKIFHFAKNKRNKITKFDSFNLKLRYTNIFQFQKQQQHQLNIKNVPLFQMIILIVLHNQRRMLIKLSKYQIKLKKKPINFSRSNENSIMNFEAKESNHHSSPKEITNLKMILDASNMILKSSKKHQLHRQMHQPQIQMIINHEKAKIQKIKEIPSSFA